MLVSLLHGAMLTPFERPPHNFVFAFNINPTLPNIRSSLVKWMLVKCWNRLNGPLAAYPISTKFPTLPLDLSMQGLSYYITITTINIYIAQIPCEYDQMRVTNMIQIKHNKLRIPTGGRLTSWLFTKRGRVEFGTTEDKSIQWQGGGLEPGTSGFQVQRYH